MRAALALTALVPAVVALAACSGGSTPHNASTDGNTAAPGVSAAPGGSTSTSTEATRWWSNGVATAGSTIDPDDPTAAAGKLEPNRAQYCEMLKQTTAAGKSILPGVSAGSPALLDAAEAFISELQHVAPREVSSDWKSVGDAVVTFVKSGGKDTSGLTSPDLVTAAQAIATDARSQCHVDISGTPAPTK